MRLQIQTVVWGGHHVELFRRTCLKSLSFKRNKEALYSQNAIWNIFTDENSIKRIEEITKEALPNLEVNIKSKRNLRNYIDPVQAATIWQIEQCITREHKLLLAPPDTIFGDGSIHGLLKIGHEPKSVVVVPHPRVLPSLVEEFNKPPTLDNKSKNLMSNPELVSLAWKHLHRAWTEAEIGCINQSSYVGGVEWQKIGESLYLVTHRLPSPYLIDFTPEDLEYFKSAISFGHFDHMWPGDILIQRGRQRYATSSDAVFICEVTEADKNVPPIIPGQPNFGFWRNFPHNQHNAQITATFRGE